MYLSTEQLIQKLYRSSCAPQKTLLLLYWKFKKEKTEFTWTKGITIPTAQLLHSDKEREVVVAAKFFFITTTSILRRRNSLANPHLVYSGNRPRYGLRFSPAQHCRLGRYNNSFCCPIYSKIINFFKTWRNGFLRKILVKMEHSACCSFLSPPGIKIFREERYAQHYEVQANHPPKQIRKPYWRECDWNPF